VIKQECLSNGYISYSIYHTMSGHCILAGGTLGAVFETEGQPGHRTGGVTGNRA